MFPKGSGSREVFDCCFKLRVIAKIERQRTHVPRQCAELKPRQFKNLSDIFCKLTHPHLTRAKAHRHTPCALRSSSENSGCFNDDSPRHMGMPETWRVAEVERNGRSLSPGLLPHAYSSRRIFPRSPKSVNPCFSQAFGSGCMSAFECRIDAKMPRFPAGQLFASLSCCLEIPQKLEEKRRLNLS